VPAFGEHRRHYYPGLIPREAALWRAWLREHEADWDSFEYDVHVGEGVRVPAPPAGQDDELGRTMRETYRRATQLKIDVVGQRKGETWIFEVEERPGRRALGQLVSYDILLPKSRPGVGPISLAIIAVRVGPDMLSIFEEHGVVVWTVPG
jgi:hypothetical protein